MIVAAPIAAGWYVWAPHATVVPPVVPSLVEVVREVPAFTAPSVVRIANIALQRVGVTQPIAALDEPSKEARVVRQVWDHVRDALLVEQPWVFALTTATLPLVTAVRVPWTYAYRMPTDALHPWGLVVAAHVQRRQDRLPYAIEADSEGSLLLTDTAPAVLRYAARVIDPVRWPGWFQDHMAWALAAEIAIPLTVKLDLAQRVEAKLAQSRITAAHRNATAGERPHADETSAFEQARGGRLSGDVWCR